MQILDKKKIILVRSQDVSNRIFGGEMVNQNEFPFIASLRYIRSAKHFCGGSIITENWILTAAHCIEKYVIIIIINILRHLTFLIEII